MNEMDGIFDQIKGGFEERNDTLNASGARPLNVCLLVVVGSGIRLTWGRRKGKAVSIQSIKNGMGGRRVYSGGSQECDFDCDCAPKRK